MAGRYNIVSVRRTPQAATTPVYSELGLLSASSVKITDFKTMKPAEGAFTVAMASMDSDTKTALLDLAADITGQLGEDTHDNVRLTLRQVLLEL